jgi:Co/Zn/Cd efflux system component
MADERDGKQTPAPALADEGTPGSHDLLRSASGSDRPGGSDSVITVLVAFGVNVLVAAAKSVAAVVTGSASLLAEAAHSWADAGNEVFLLIANRRSRRPPDLAHRPQWPALC